MKAAIVIPARYGSTRLPGKPLVDILGKPMIQHVFERAKQSVLAQDVIVATDDRRILDAVKNFGGKAMLTDSEHASGTDRIVEVAQEITADLFINVQGDEPLIRPQNIDLLIRSMLDGTEVATLCHPISREEAQDPNSVKVVTAHDGTALYFSRHAIPYPRDGHLEGSYLRHVGIYGYQADILSRWSGLPRSPLEETEKLEQLRLLQAGIRIKVVEVDEVEPGVDTPECLERVRRILSERMK